MTHDLYSSIHTTRNIVISHPLLNKHDELHNNLAQKNKQLFRQLETIVLLLFLASDNMASNFIRIEVQCTFPGKSTKYILYSRGQRTVSTLKLYFKEIYGLDGTLYLRQNYIKAKKTITELQLKKEDVLELKHITKTPARKTQLISCTVQTSPDEKHQIQVPVSCTVESLLFHIECEKQIPKENQCFECATRRYVMILNMLENV